MIGGKSVRTLMLVGGAIFAVACTQDFAQYTPPADGGASTDAPADASALPDAAIADTGPKDAACTPPSSCIDTAQSCNDQCKNQRSTCRNQCPPITDGGFDACRDQCDKTRDLCRNGCETACNTCTTNASCPSPSQCKNAVN